MAQAGKVPPAPPVAPSAAAAADFRQFLALVEAGSFTRAAEELSITQSAVSRHIRTLEEHFACRLFQRSGRNLQLTEAARLLLYLFERDWGVQLLRGG